MLSPLELEDRRFLVLNKIEALLVNTPHLVTIVRRVLTDEGGPPPYFFRKRKEVDIPDF